MNAVSNHTHTVTTNASSTGSSGDGNTGSAGNSNAHNNMQPYLAVYMWERYE